MAGKGSKNLKNNREHAGRTAVRRDGLDINLRLTVLREEKFFGPGISKLMHLIDENGSIRSAAEIMGMSYSKAWKILKRADKELAFPLLKSQNGGDGGGKSALTEKGRAFMENYDKMEAELQAEAQRLLSKYFPEKL